MNKESNTNYISIDDIKHAGRQCENITNKTTKQEGIVVTSNIKDENGKNQKMKLLFPNMACALNHYYFMTDGQYNLMGIQENTENTQQYLTKAVVNANTPEEKASLTKAQYIAVDIYTEEIKLHENALKALLYADKKITKIEINKRKEKLQIEKTKAPKI